LGNLKNKKKAFGKTDQRVIAHFYQGKMDCYLDRESEDYYSAIAFGKIFNNQSFMNQVEKEVKKAASNLLIFAASFYHSDLNSYSNQKLIYLLKKFNELYAEIFAFGLVNTYDQKLVAQTKKYFLSNWPQSKANYFFTILTSSTKDTYYLKEEKDLLRAAIKIKNDKKTEGKVLDQLVKDYSWLLINYEGKLRTKNDFKKIVRKIIKENKNPNKTLRDLEIKKKKLIAEQKKLEQKLKISPLYHRLIKAIRKNAYLREYRKPLAVKAIFYERKLLNEIAKRLSLTEKELKFLLTPEIEKALRTDRVDRKLIKKRINGSVYNFRRNSYQVFTGLAAKKLLQQITTKQKTDLEEVSGLSAYPGKVKGKVRVILDLSSLKGFKTGEILVTPATSPEMVSIFKKAKAVVTDEGGLTSHAAIISREMGVPCIVGTKLATLVLKNGDLVEVDAERGEVRKIKK
jgi:phosphohistidine swiveling domain-containing protein